jgi:divalent metal cation (Fe/Co/Zn/Cd) transporter
MHVDVDPNLSLKESHKIAHLVQNNVKNEINIIQFVITHVCPFGEEYNHD